MKSVAWRFVKDDGEIMVRWSRDPPVAALDIARVLNLPLSTVLSRLRLIGPHLSKCAGQPRARRDEMPQAKKVGGE